MSTLVLNADYSPFNILPLSSISWKEAIKSKYLGSVNVIHEYENWVVHSPSVSMKVPSIVVLKDFIKKKETVRWSKYNLCLRDKFTCQYCDSKLNLDESTIDHVIPRVRGGKSTWTNTCVACYKCNFDKGHRTSYKPRNRPYRPDYYELVEQAKKLRITIPDPVWNDYLCWDESLVVVKNI